MVPSRPTAGPPPLVSVEIRQATVEDWAPTMGVLPRRSGPFMNIDHWPLGRAAWVEGRACDVEAGTSPSPPTATMTNRAERTERPRSVIPFVRAILTSGRTYTNAGYASEDSMDSSVGAGVRG